MGRLDGKVALVTGASSGIGLAVAMALGKEGMQVVMVSRSMTAEKASVVPGAVAMACDVVSREKVHATVGEVMSKFGKIDLLVNCAGVMRAAASSRVVVAMSTPYW